MLSRPDSVDNQLEEDGTSPMQSVGQYIDMGAEKGLITEF